MGGYSNRGVGSAFQEKKVENKPPPVLILSKNNPGGGGKMRGGFSNWYTGLRQMFVFASTFQEHVKFLSTSGKHKR